MHWCADSACTLCVAQVGGVTAHAKKNAFELLAHVLADGEAKGRCATDLDNNGNQAAGLLELCMHACATYR